MNSNFVVEQSDFIAERAKKDAGENLDSQISRIFELLLNRQPSQDELAACRGVELKLVARTLINSNEFAFLP
jgi:hypothetical protein